MNNNSEADIFGSYLTGQNDPLNQQRDDKALRMAQIQNDLNNIR
jgi:hypothetical protein